MAVPEGGVAGLLGVADLAGCRGGGPERCWVLLLGCGLVPRGVDVVVWFSPDFFR